MHGVHHKIITNISLPDSRIMSWERDNISWERDNHVVGTRYYVVGTR